MKVFGNLEPTVHDSIQRIVSAAEGLVVVRSGAARSGKPLPTSRDLEKALLPLLTGEGFQYQVELLHPRTGQGFAYDYWRPSDGMALEVMGYRADDEVYKDLLKFHVHNGTHVGVVLVPRWKWVGGKRQDRNYAETMKALAFADSFMDVKALVALVYDWEATREAASWTLRFIDEG